MTKLKQKEKKRMEVSEKMRKISLITLLSLVLVVMMATASFASQSDGSPIDPVADGSGSTGKNTTMTSNSITKSTPTAADTYGAQTINGNHFYLPNGVPNPNAATIDGRIHANYSANTDACAACHFTHTAPGTRLLQWGSIYEACAACHDGSLGDYTYDVFSGKIGTDANARTFGGLFGSTVDIVYDANNYVFGEANATSISNHMANGYMALSAAPGADANNSGESSTTFDCASCHTPHGQGGNARILSPDPGKLLIDNFFTTDTTYPVAVNGNYVTMITADAAASTTFTTTGSKHWIQGYPYNRITGVFLANDASSPVFNFNPNETDATKKNVYSETAGVVKLVYGTDYTINWRNGAVTLLNTATITGNAGDEVWVTRVPGIFVAMDIENYMESNENVEYVAIAIDQNGYDGASDDKEGINAYCGACHGLYNTQGEVLAGGQEYDFVSSASGKNHGSGHVDTDSDTKFRHQVGFKWVDQWTGKADYVKFAYEINLATGNVKKGANDPKVFTCLSCHFAHGTNNEYWEDYVDKINTANGTTAATDLDDLADVDELFGSSALKRLPNMSICENCHDKKGGNNKATTDGGAFYY